MSSIKIFILSIVDTVLTKYLYTNAVLINTF